MKILWICNTSLPIIEKEIGVNNSITAGWITSLFEVLSSDNDIEFVICFPWEKEEKIFHISDRIVFYSFIRKNILKYNNENETLFRTIIEKEKPDIIHIWGTEFPHSLAMINASVATKKIDNTVVSIQGLISLYGNSTDHYYAGLQESITKRCTVRDFLKNDSIEKQRDKFSIRGRFEVETLKLAKHVIGRTEWDKQCVKRINPQLHYYHCNETLRHEFYSDKWDYSNCQKHSIFVSQCSYPLKGFHRILNPLRKIVDDFPDTILYTTGDSPLLLNTFFKQQRKTYYSLYLRKLIRYYGLTDNIVFCGSLDAPQMKERLLKSNVFLLPSSIENSSNSLGEAMLLGVPCVASEVGGIKTLVDDGVEGLLFPFDESYLIESYVRKIFTDTDFALLLSNNAQNKAKVTHDQNNNLKTLRNIYLEIM